MDRSLYKIYKSQVDQILKCACLFGSSPQQTAADRNSRPISEALSDKLDTKTKGLQLLEISSGSGQHASYLAPLFANITFQPTEYEHAHFASIAAYAAKCSTANIRQPLYIDIAQDPEEWEALVAGHIQLGSYDYMLNCNMMHITPWECSVGLFRAAGLVLKPGGSLFTYGPYAVKGKLEPDSNIRFDRSLRSRNAKWGVRDIEDLKKLSADNAIDLESILEMPSNNKFLSWVKRR